MGKKECIVLKAFMHCEGCSEKVSKCLRGFDGVEQVAVDRENHIVVVKGKNIGDPACVLERLRKKYSKNVELISPKPQNQSETNQKEEEDLAFPPVKIVTLKMFVHCEGCANDVKRSVERMKGVVSVNVEKEKSEVTVRGIVDATQLIEFIKKRFGKHVEIVNEQVEEQNEKECNNNNDIVVFTYPPQYCTQYLYPNQTFSDENVFSCSIM